MFDILSSIIALFIVCLWAYIMARNAGLIYGALCCECSKCFDIMIWSDCFDKIVLLLVCYSDILVTKTKTKTKSFWKTKISLVCY